MVYVNTVGREIHFLEGISLKRLYTFWLLSSILFFGPSSIFCKKYLAFKKIFKFIKFGFFSIFLGVWFKSLLWIRYFFWFYWKLWGQVWSIGVKFSPFSTFAKSSDVLPKIVALMVTSWKKTLLRSFRVTLGQKFQEKGQISDFIESNDGIPQIGGILVSSPKKVFPSSFKVIKGQKVDNEVNNFHCN